MVRETGVQKMVLGAALLNTQHYKVRIKGKVEQSREWSSTLPYLSVVAIEKGAFGLLSTAVAYSSFPWTAPLTLDAYAIMLSIK